MTHLDLSAAVLVGGASRRMGEPKALIRLRRDGQTMLEMVVARVDAVASEVLLVGSPAWSVPRRLAALPKVADDGTSAADGVIAALRGCRHELCLVTGCDMPFLHRALLRDMARHAVGEGRGVIAVDGAGEHPLHAVYHREALPAIEQLVTAGERSLAVLARAANMLVFPIDGPGRDDRDRWSVFNVNTREDLAVARHRARDAPAGEELY